LALSGTAEEGAEEVVFHAAAAKAGFKTMHLPQR
jgi:hypothetical protein